MAGSPVVWRSKLKSTISILTCIAEYSAIFVAVRDCAWIRSFITEIDQIQEEPISVLEDNTGVIKLATNH